MLYTEEKVVNLYDVETGTYQEKAAAEMERKEYLELKGKAQAYSQLIRSSGWKLLKKDLETAIDYFKDQLIVETDPAKITRFQEAVKTYKQVLAMPEHAVYLANSYNQTDTDVDNLGE